MLSGGSGKFPRSERRCPKPQGTCRGCLAKIDLIHQGEAGWVVPVHSELATSRCEGSGQPPFEHGT